MKHTFKVTGAVQFFFMLFAVFFLSSPNAIAKVIIIANDHVDIQRMNKSEIKDIFLGREVKWPDGNQIKIVIFSYSSEVMVHKEFTHDYLQKSTSQFSRYWKRMLFLGKGIFPLEVEDESEMIQKIKEAEGSIGYISSEKPVGGVRVIDITDK